MRIVFIVVFICLAKCSFGQSEVNRYRHYSTKDGLPSPTIYHMHQSQDGYLWFATDNGISRFDGYEFKNYSGKDGLEEFSFLKIYEDQKGKLWFIPFSCQPYTYSKGELSKYPLKQEFFDYFRSPVISTFVPREDGSLFLGTTGEGAVNIQPDGSYVFYRESEKPTYKIIRSGDELLYFAHSGSDFTTRNDLWRLSFIRNEEETTNIDWLPLSRSNLNGLLIGENNSIASYGKTIHFFENGKRTDEWEFDDQVISLFLDHEDFLWIGLFKNGVKKYKLENGLWKEQDHLFTNYSVTKVLEDNEGGIWISTLEDGVFYVSNMDVITIIDEDGLAENSIAEIAGDGKGGVVLGHRNGFLTLFQDHEIEMTVDLNKRLGTNTPVRAMLFWPENDEYLISVNGRTHAFNYGKNRDIEVIAPFTSRNYDISADGGVWASDNWLYKITEDYEMVFDEQNHSVHVERTLDIDEGFEGELLLSKRGKIHEFINGKYVSLTATHSFFENDIYMIRNLNNEYVIFASNLKGLMIASKTDTLFIDHTSGLLGNRVWDVELDRLGQLWVGTDNGINRIHLDKPISVEHITAENGLVSDDVEELYIDDDLVYIGTNAGLNILPIDFKVQNDLDKIHLLELTTNRTTHSMFDKLVIPYEENSISINFKLISFKSAGEITYRYKLIPEQTDFTETKSLSTHFSNLPPGNYEFIVQARSLHSEWNESTIIQFSIETPFWLSWWFYLLIVVFIVLFIIILVRRIIRYVKRREKEKSDIEKLISSLQLRSIQAQFNPHFTFNTLNSIHNYIGEHDSKSARNYLSMFSSLMRSILVNSEKKTITLREEIFMLEKYLKLEQMRFGNLSYDIQVAPDLDLDFDRLPPMLIQPLAENAVNHGIYNKEGEGKVVFSFSLRNETLICIVEDNGIGREKARLIQESKRKKGTGKGIQLVRQRLNLLTDDFSGELYIEDLSNALGEAIGTRVTIEIETND